MFSLQMKVLVLLASTYILPLANARCSPYLPNQTPEDTSPEPEKCWICPDKGPDGFTLDSPASAEREDGIHTSWDNFNCKYSRSEGQDENGNPHKRLSGFCRYDVNGELRDKRSSCPPKAIPRPNCTPSRPFSGAQQICCGENCKLETDQCFTCPPMDNTLYVDVAINPNILACFGKYQSRMAAPRYYFDAQTGNLLASMYGGSAPDKAPLRAGCAPKPVAVPGANCAADATHDQCVKEAQQDAYRSFNTWNRCRPYDDYCKNRTIGSFCWACPRIEGTDAVEEKDIGATTGTCTYYKRDESGVLKSANTVCEYYLGVGGELVPDGARKGNTLTCPSQSDQDLTCARLKKAEGK